MTMVRRTIGLFSICFFLLQTARAQIRWAITAGPQINYAGYKSNGTKLATGLVAGFTAGISGRVYFDDKLAFVSGILYSAKGYSVRSLPTDPSKKYQLNYLEIPVLLQIDLAAKAGQGLYCRMGPSLGIGISGRESYTGTDGIPVRNAVILSVTGNHFGLFDASLNACLGFMQHKKIFAELVFAYGIGNINNDVLGAVIKTRTAAFRIGYCFH